MIYRLIVLNGPARGQRLTVPDAAVTVGSGEVCGFRVDDAEMASRHAELEQTDDGLVIRDLDTMNKILVNRHEVGVARLRHGDVVELGRTRFLVQVSVQAEVIDAKAGANPPPRRRFQAASFAWLLVAAAIVAGISFRLYFAGRDRDRLRDATWESLDERLTRPPPGLPANLPPIEEPGAPEMSTAAPPETPEPSITPSAPVASPAEVPEPAAPRPPPVVEPAHKEPASPVVAEPAPPEDERRAVPADPGVPPRSPHKEPRPAVASPRPEPVPERLVKIASVEQTRFPSSRDVAEMRLFKVTLAPVSRVELIDPGEVKVAVQVYDKHAKTGAVEPSRAVVTAGELMPAGAWLPGRQKTVDVTYVMPLATSPDGVAARFYGYRVALYYRDDLQDTRSQPVGLGER